MQSTRCIGVENPNETPSKICSDEEVRTVLTETSPTISQDTLDFILEPSVPHQKEGLRHQSKALTRPGEMIGEEANFYS